MKYALFPAVLLWISVATAQEEISPFIFSPPEPKSNQVITLVYNDDSPAAVLKDVPDITCHALVDRYEADPVLFEIPLKKESGAWRGTFTIDDADACVVLFTLVSDDKKDDNGGSPWHTIMYGKDDKPVKGGHLTAGLLHLRGRIFNVRHKPDLEKAKFHFRKEKELYPKQWQATTGLWDVRFKEKNQPDAGESLKSEIASFYSANKDNEKAVSAVIFWWEKMGDSAKADDVRKSEIRKNPKGLIAQEARSIEVWKEEDNQKRIELLKAFLYDFPSLDKKARQMNLQNLFNLQIQSGEIEAAADVFEKIDKPGVSNYNSIAWKYIEKDMDLEKAVAWAKKGVDMTNNPDPSDKPPYMTMKDWTKSNKYYSNMVMDTYGYGLLKLGKFDEAENVLAEVFANSKGEDAEENLHYIEALEKNGKYDKAIEIGMEAVASGKDSEEIIEVLKSAFAKKTGSDGTYANLNTDQKREFDDMLSNAVRIKIERIGKTLKETRVNTAGVDFTLRDINGAPVSLSGLRGKVVVIDFWATWCGPCRASFPSLQKVYEKYRDHDKVVILAINSWERQNDYSAQVKNAVDFLQKNGYTFPVLIDEKNEDQFIVISKYEVEGIPTKFVLDKNGVIAWKTVGFDNGQYMIDELTQQIEMLLSE